MRLAIDDLLARYIHALDDGRLEAWPDFFAANGQYRITTAENHERGLPFPIMQAESRAMMRDRVSALRHANIYEAQRYRHVLSGTLVEHVHGHIVHACSSFMVVRTMHTGEQRLFATGRYLDRIRLAADGSLPQFEEKVVVLDSRQVDTLLAIPL